MEYKCKKVTIPLYSLTVKQLSIKEKHNYGTGKN